MYSSDKARQILTLALEIEGLALLIQRRGDLVNPEVNCILHDKASSLLELTKVIAGQQAHDDTVVSADSESSVVSAEPAISTAQCVEEKYEKNPSTEPAEDKTHDNAAEYEVPAADDDFVCRPTADRASADEMAIADSAVEEEVADSGDDVVTDQKATEPVPAAASAQTPAQVAELPVFTLNDRFRFIRELFKGSNQDFNDTLRLVSSMSSADEVIEYLSDDLCLDPENPDVADFTAIVTQRFH